MKQLEFPNEKVEEILKLLNITVRNNFIDKCEYADEVHINSNLNGIVIRFSLIKTSEEVKTDIINRLKNLLEYDWIEVHPNFETWRKGKTFFSVIISSKYLFVDKFIERLNEPDKYCPE